jgi:hypothetical protein
MEKPGIRKIGKAVLRLEPPTLHHEDTELANLDLYRKFMDEVVGFLDAHQEQRRLVEINPDWSQAGKAKKLAEIDAKCKPHFDDFRRRFANIKEMFTNDAEKYRPKPFAGSGNPVLDELRAQEIRRTLLSMERSERVNFAINPNADPIILWAIETSPVPIPELSNPELITRIKEAKMMALNPEGTLVIGDQETVLKTIGFNLSEAAKNFEPVDNEV